MSPHFAPISKSIQMTKHIDPHACELRDPDGE